MIIFPLVVEIWNQERDLRCLLHRTGGTDLDRALGRRKKATEEITLVLVLVLLLHILLEIARGHLRLVGGGRVLYENPEGMHLRLLVREEVVLGPVIRKGHYHLAAEIRLLVRVSMD